MTTPAPIEPSGGAAALAGGAHYRVEYATRYAYQTPVTQSWQLVRLTPRALPWQALTAHRLEIEPPPDERRDAPDSFGNAVTHVALHGPHRLLRVVMTASVVVGDRPGPIALGSADEASWESVRDGVARAPTYTDLLPVRLAEPTRMLPLSDAALAYARPSFAPGRAWFDAVHALMRRIHADFVFDVEATTVDSSVDEVLALRRGVCQDFTHLMLACLRGLGLPARYMSGYLLTDPPPGRPRLLGVDASHAWVAAWSPAHGWVEFDPTNDQLADRRYITLAWGGDFADVAPLRGVFVGGGEQRLRTAVSVIPL